MSSLLFSSFPQNGTGFHGLIDVLDRHFAIGIAVQDQDTALYIDERLEHVLQGYQEEIKKRLKLSDNVQSFIVTFKDLLERLLVNQTQDMPDPDWVEKELNFVGWDKVLDISPDLKQLTLIMLDSTSRQHEIRVEIPSDATQAISMESTTPLPIRIPQKMSFGRIDAMYKDFSKAMEQFVDFWNQMDDLDNNTWILEPLQPTRADTSRRLALGKHCSLVIQVDPSRPTNIPTMKFLGAEAPVNVAKQVMNSNLSNWNPQASLRENLGQALQQQLPTKPLDEEEAQALDCGICYAYKLTLDDKEFTPDEMCNNDKCSQAFHYSCLYEFFRTDSNTKQTFDRLMGNCPYCGEQISIDGFRR